jgi:hypothetical protein
MHCFSVRKQDYTQVPSARARYGRPAADSAIMLDHFTFGVGNYLLDPLDLNGRTIRPHPHGYEILGAFHAIIITITFAL